MLFRTSLAAVGLILLVSSVRAQTPVEHYQVGPGVRQVLRVDALTALKRTMNLTRGPQPPVSPTELDLLEDCKFGTPTHWNMAGAALVIVGVKNKADVDRYLRQLDEIEMGARKAVAGAKSTAQAAKLLLAYLHAGPMRSGYVSQQSNLAKLLDTGTFNCVSSTVLFNLMARRLGMEVQAVEVPSHVFAIVHDGAQAIDVEATNPKGIRDPAKRADRIAKLVQDTDVDYVALYGEDLYRDTGDLGLLSLMYSRQATEMTENKRFGDAAIITLKSLCMDPQSSREVRRLKKVYSSWFRFAMQQKDYRQAMAVATTYQQLLRDPSDASKLVREAQQKLSQMSVARR